MPSCGGFHRLGILGIYTQRPVLTAVRIIDQDLYNPEYLLKTPSPIQKNIMSETPN